ncbi:HAD family hydrolase [Haloglycomyces albus]|uniref:HAD family hydrolase n=1 Tax=Haloglycomyces albus TaxID=526067 RepID=UPI00046CAEBE|nr:HAD family hydrolase [Haloglycomyces albus]
MYETAPQATRRPDKTDFSQSSVDADTPDLIAVDIDGTIVDYQEKEFTEPSLDTIAALRKAYDAGIPVAIVTGRPTWGAARVAHQLDLPEAFVSASHGAVEYQLSERRISHAESMDPKLAVDTFRSVHSKVEFAFEWDLKGWYHTSGFARDFAAHWAEVKPLRELTARSAARMVARVPSKHHYQAGQRCPEALRLAEAAQLSEQHYYVEPGYNGWVDVSPAGMTKATGLARIADHYGVSANRVAVFGDAHNDLPMFEWAGYAIAMGQADESVKAVADEVTLPVADNGVASVIHRWLK